MPADGSNIATFPTRLRVVEQASAGRHGFAPPEAPRIDQDGGRVLIDGRRLKTFVSESNAARLAAALQVVADLAPEFLPEPPRSPEAA